MKISKKELKKMIKEEIQSLNEMDLDRTWDDVREGKVTVWGFGDESFETATIYQGGANPTGLGTVFGDIKLSLNEWHHIAVVRSDSNMQLLVDNELDKLGHGQVQSFIPITRC